MSYEMIEGIRAKCDKCGEKFGDGKDIPIITHAGADENQRSVEQRVARTLKEDYGALSIFSPQRKLLVTLCKKCKSIIRTALNDD